MARFHGTRDVILDKTTIEHSRISRNLNGIEQFAWYRAKEMFIVLGYSQARDAYELMAFIKVQRGFA